MTLGEQRVRVNFNPSQVDLVSQIKQKSAELINVIDSLKEKWHDEHPGASVAPGEMLRSISLAQTAYEEAAMWAVKAATYGL